MKPPVFDVMESGDHWADMKGDYADDICDEVKRFLSGLPGTFNHDSVKDLKLAYHLLECFVERLNGYAKPYADDLAERLAADGHIDSLIDEGKE